MPSRVGLPSDLRAAHPSASGATSTTTPISWHACSPPFGVAPSGACVLSAVVQFAPHALKEGWETGKPKFQAAILDMLERYSPGIGKTVRLAELLTPTDIEARFRMPGGHWHHGELQVDQMLMNRPVHGADGYDTPLEGLFLAGAGSHPGGGISGAPGWNAAKRIIEMRG